MQPAGRFSVIYLLTYQSYDARLKIQLQHDYVFVWLHLRHFCSVRFCPSAYLLVNNVMSLIDYALEKRSKGSSCVDGRTNRNVVCANGQ